MKKKRYDLTVPRTCQNCGSDFMSSPSNVANGGGKYCSRRCQGIASRGFGQRGHGPLENITRELLEPVWSRLDIPTEKIADTLGVTRAAISARARGLGLPSRVGNKECCRRGSDETFKRMWEAGLSRADIAKALGYTHPASVAERRKKMGLPPRRRRSGQGGWAGWETISLEEYNEMELARLMQGAA